MTRKIPFPRRPQAHIVGDKAVEQFRGLCSKAWVVTEPEQDYGVDLRIETTKGEYVTGQEFVVQIKGRSSIGDTGSKLVTAKISSATINYWLQKVTPTMIAVVDTATGVAHYDWLEFCYTDYPSLTLSNDKISLALRHRSDSHDLNREVTGYLHHYYKSMSADMKKLSNGIFLSNMLFSIAALHRAATRTTIELQQSDWPKTEELRTFLKSFCFEFASHDQLMSGLRSGAFGHLPSHKSRLLHLIEAKLRNYDELRDKLLEYAGQTSDKSGTNVRPLYGNFSDWLIPMVRVLEDVEETLGLAQVANKSLVVPIND